MLSQAKIKKLLHYNPDTGVFTWKKTINNRAIAGNVAGGKCNEYICIRINYKAYYAHRLAWLYMTGEWPEEIDHKNHIKIENWFDNLRDATHHENGKNQPQLNTNTSGITGVSWYEKTNKWLAYIHTKEKQEHLGYFPDKFEAICARKSAEIKHDFHPNHGL